VDVVLDVDFDGDMDVNGVATVDDTLPDSPRR
jgi:hypothetical protein